MSQTKAQLLDGSVVSVAFSAGSVGAPSLCFTGDTNTGIYSPAADTLAFAEGGVEALRIDSSGRVGIGTSSPGSQNTTQVTSNNDGIRVQLQATPIGGEGPRLIFGHSTNNGTQQIFAAIKSLMVDGNDVTWNSDLAFYTGGSSLSERARIDSSGRVGIGTTSPASPFNVVSSSAPAVILQNPVASNYTSLRLYNDQNSSVRALEIYYGGSTYSGGEIGNIVTTGAYPLVLATNNTERARIDSSGRLLVGTSSSTQTDATVTGLLQIQSSAAERGISQLHTSNDASATFLQFSKIRSTSIVQSGDFLGRIQFNGYDGSAYKPAAAIDAQVDGTPSANDMPGRLVFSTTADGAASPTERMRIDSSGRVLIGTSTAVGAALLQVQGNVTSSGDITAAGNVTAYSDANLKTNIQIIDNALDKILQLDGITFTRTDLDNKVQRHAGVIAQTVEKVLPEVVYTDSEGIKSVAYGNMIALCIEAIKELQTKIKILENAK